MIRPLILAAIVLCSLSVFACQTDETTPPGADATSGTSDANAALDAEPPPDTTQSNDASTATTTACSSPLIRLQTSQDPDCGGGNTHLWPVGLQPSDCHGWKAVDTGGSEHNNSANDIRCNSDGTFSFTQFAGSLECAGTGVTKNYELNVCQQDIPPSLYTVAVDVACCFDPDSSECIRGMPSVSVPGATVYLNGGVCED